MTDTTLSSSIVAELGRDNICSALSMSRRRVNEAAQEGLPASWYDALCIMAGRDLPRSAFTFKRVDPTQ